VQLTGVESAVLCVVSDCADRHTEGAVSGHQKSSEQKTICDLICAVQFTRAGRYMVM